MNQHNQEDSEGFNPTKPVVAFIVLTAVMLGMAESPASTATALAGATISLVASKCNARIAPVLIALSCIIMWFPQCYATSIATIFGAAAGWLIEKSRERQTGIARQAEDLNLQNKLVAESQIELLKSDEVSRYLLAADLHDQSLNDQKALAEALRAHKNALKPQEYNKAISKLTAVMTETREIMDRLYPAQIDVIGLSESLDSLLSRTCRAFKCKARFRDRAAPGVVERLNELERIVVYRIAEEALVNACRHADAKTISIDIESDDTDLSLLVRDDGKGMARQLFVEPGRGLRFIMVRADLIGAIVGWTAGAEGKGTKLELRLPMPPELPGAEISLASTRETS